MKVVIDDNSGFCFGVVYAIQMAEDELDQAGYLYCLGDIVHNDIEVKRLEKKGLRIITHEQLSELRDCKVLIRAHGESPETYKLAVENNIELIDASCPVVLKLQNRVKTSFDHIQGDEAQIVIYGIPGHAEVNGLLGQTNGKAVIVTSEEDLDKIDFNRPVHLFSQTTKSTDNFYRIRQLIEEKMNRNSGTGQAVLMNDTICRQVSNREPQLRRFVKQFDVIIFVSGRKSSNGKVLYNVCHSENSRSYFVSDIGEIQTGWFDDAKTVGICGATSTPMWLMEQVANHIAQIKSETIA